jgi:uncharacterized protein (DUF58 family)
VSRFSRALARAGIRTRLGRALLMPLGRSRRRDEAGWRSPIDERLLRRLERLALVPAGPIRGERPGEHRALEHARSGDYVDQRPYSPGDDIRQIDWHAYARLDQLHVKVSEAHQRSTMYLLLDCSRSMGTGVPDKFDVARQVAAALSYVALARFDRVQLLPLDRTSGPILQGKQRFGHLMHLLDELRPHGELDLGRAVASLRPAAGPGRAVLLSDLLLPGGYLPALEQLERRGARPAVIQVLSPSELSPTEAGEVLFVDVESGERVDVGLTPTAMVTYQQRLRTWNQALAASCAGRGWPYVQMRSDEQLAQVVLVAARGARLVA